MKIHAALRRIVDTMSPEKQEQNDRFIPIGLDIKSLSQSQSAVRRNKITGKIKKIDVRAKDLKTPKQEKKHMKRTETETEIARKREKKRKKMKKKKRFNEEIK